jgi:hypothetical protein
MFDPSSSGRTATGRSDTRLVSGIINPGDHDLQITVVGTAASAIHGVLQGCP